MITVLVVDDHLFVREAFGLLLKSTGLTKKIYSAATTSEAKEITKVNHIDIAFIDARLNESSGIILAATLMKQDPKLKVVGITSFDEDETITEMLQAGVNGILLKRNTDFREITHCLHQLMAGNNYFNQDITSRLARNDFNSRNSRLQFTKRELEVLALLTKGQSTKQIASTLELKENTIEDYRKEMIRKAGVKNTTELIALALRNGILG